MDSITLITAIDAALAQQENARAMPLMSDQDATLSPIESALPNVVDWGCCDHSGLASFSNGEEHGNQQLCNTVDDFEQALFGMCPALRGAPLSLTVGSRHYELVAACGLTGKIVRRQEQGSSDLDLFVVSSGGEGEPSAAERDEAYLVLVAQLRDHLNQGKDYDHPAFYATARTAFAHTFSIVDAEHTLDIQVIHRIYPSRFSVPADFDSGSCQVLWCAEGVFLTPLAVLAFTTGVCLLRYETWRRSTISRARNKVIGRGYTLTMLDFPMDLLTTYTTYSMSGANTILSTGVRYANGVYEVAELASITYETPSSSRAYTSIGIDYHSPETLVQTWIGGLVEHGTRANFLVAYDPHSTLLGAALQPTATLFYSVWKKHVNRLSKSYMKRSAFYRRCCPKDIIPKVAFTITTLRHIIEQCGPMPYTVMGHGDNAFVAIDMNMELFFGDIETERYGIDLNQRDPPAATSKSKKQKSDESWVAVTVADADEAPLDSIEESLQCRIRAADEREVARYARLDVFRMKRREARDAKSAAKVAQSEAKLKAIRLARITQRKRLDAETDEAVRVKRANKTKVRHAEMRKLAKTMRSRKGTKVLRAKSKAGDLCEHFASLPPMADVIGLADAVKPDEPNGAFSGTIMIEYKDGRAVNAVIGIDNA